MFLSIFSICLLFLVGVFLVKFFSFTFKKIDIFKAWGKESDSKLKNIQTKVNKGTATFEEEEIYKKYDTLSQISHIILTLTMASLGSYGLINYKELFGSFIYPILSALSGGSLYVIYRLFKK